MANDVASENDLLMAVAFWIPVAVWAVSVLIVIALDWVRGR